MDVMNAEPAEINYRDVIGYLGKNEFVILIACKLRGPRELPQKSEIAEVIPCGIPCSINNNQKVRFNHAEATLHNIDGEWHYKMQGSQKLKRLDSSMFFEISESG